jgi:hypothetical protein
MMSRKENAMKRVEIDSERWFDLDRALSWNEATYQSVSLGIVSVATHLPGLHEMLFITHLGTWLLHRWNAWRASEGPDIVSSQGYEMLTQADAAKWLSQNGHRLPRELKDFDLMKEI